MHTMTLVAVNIPPINETPNNPTPETVQTMLQYIALKKAILSGEEKHFMADFYLGRMVGRMTAFSREVDNRIYEYMEPYFTETEDTKYLEFTDCTDEVIEEYETKTVDCVKGSNGVIYDCHSSVGHKFVIIDGVVYQKSAGPLHHPKRTKKAKRMTALPNYPIKKLFKSWQEYAVHGCGYGYIEETDRCGYVSNNNAFFDWCQIGGRYPFAFLVKETCYDYSHGDFPLGVRDERPAPDGYHWVAAARKKDIEWDLMHDWYLRRSIRNYYELQNAFMTGVIDPAWCANIRKDRITTFGDVLYYKGERIMHYLRRHGWLRKSKYHMSTGAVVLTDGTYHDAYDYGHDKDPAKKREWCRLLDDFIDSLDENAVLVSVDCHM